MEKMMFRGLTYGYNQEDLEWVYGCNVFVGNNSTSFIYDEQSGKRNIVWTETLGRYTGLEDINGHPIYEGDIILYNNNFGCNVYSLVKFGKFKCDDIETIGFYGEMLFFVLPEWLKRTKLEPCDYERTISLLHWQVGDPKIVGYESDKEMLLDAAMGI